uniref:Uncharacterized protein n=1 Tax=Triticum urartu TaxID=4572 RepID=A0A8R7URV0_TRIUA
VNTNKACCLLVERWDPGIHNHRARTQIDASINIVPLAPSIGLHSKNLELLDAVGDLMAPPKPPEALSHLSDEAFLCTGTFDVMNEVVDAVLHIIGHLPDVVPPVLGRWIKLVHELHLVKESFHGAELILEERCLLPHTCELLVLFAEQ